MDYEKAYKEALNKAKRLWEGKDSSPDEPILEYLFPILTESEEEATRKELIDYLKQTGIGKSKSKPMIDKFIKWINEWETITKRGNGLYYFGDGVVTHVDSPATEPPLDITQPSVVIEDNKAKDESEDERVRQRIVSFISQLKVCDNTKNKCLTWLEKQKEQKQSETEKEYVKTLKGLVSDFIRDTGGGITDVAYYQKICDWLEGRHIEQKPADLPPGFYFIDLDGKKYYSKEFRFGDMKMKIVEDKSEKPAEWSEDDTSILSDAITAVDSMITKEYKESHPTLYEAFKVAKDWLKSLPERFNLQPKQEWSEEDEEMLEKLLSIIEPSNGYAEIRDWLLPKFKSLRPSWKPSEDEERLTNTSISFLKDFADKGYENAVECIDWLKSKLDGNTCE